MATIDEQSVLVTGASGFIGVRLVGALLARQCRVTCLVRPTSHAEALRSAGAHLITGDVTDSQSVQRALSEAQAATVFHLAGVVKTYRRSEFDRVNAGGVANVAAACAECVSPPVLVVVSSLSAAGPCVGGRVHVEGDRAAPVSHYGSSKLAGEQAAARHGGEVPMTLVRPPMVFGPGDRGLLEMFRPIARRGLHAIPGRADRPWAYSLIHVDDLVAGLLRVAVDGERLGEPGSSTPAGQGIYYLAADEHPTYAELGHMMADALAQPPPRMLYLPRPVMRLVGVGGDVVGRLCRRAGWINSDKVTEALAGSWMCSAAKAREQLNWTPEATLSDRLHETAQWYRQAACL